MNASTGIIIVFVFIGILIIMTVCRFGIQRRQLSSGRNIGCFLPHKEGGVYIFDNPVTISTGEKWCRLLLRFKAQGAHQISYNLKYLFKRVALVTGTPYTLTISDTSGHVLYEEEDNLSNRWGGWIWSRGGGTQTLFSERERGTYKGIITLLEFLPKYAGQYRILLEIQSRTEDKAPGSSSYWEVSETELTVKEDVIPLSKTVKYIHKRVYI